MGVLAPDSNATHSGPSLGGLLRLAPTLVNEDPTTLTTMLREEYGHVVRIPPLHPALDSEVYLLTHPEDVRFVLQSDPTKFGTLDVPATQDFGRVIQDSVVSMTVDADPDAWLKRTRMVHPEFAERAVQHHVPALAETTLATLAEIGVGPGRMHADSASIPDGARVTIPGDDAVRLLPAMRRLSLRLLGVSLFGADIRAHEVEVIDAVCRLRSLYKQRQLGIVTSRVTRHLPEELHLPTWLRGPLGADPSVRVTGRQLQRAEAAIGTLEDVADAMVQRRERTPLVFADGLTTWLLRPDPVTEDVLSPETLRQEVIGLLIAGHATTSAALTWAFYLLASRPGVQERLRAEAQANPLFASLPSAKADPASHTAVRRSAEDAGIAGEEVLASLPYTRQVWKETLRLYPALPIFGRAVNESVTVNGTELAAGAHVLLSPFVTHRDEAFWADPERFDPSRFSPDREHDRPEFAYFPFSAGPHACLGRAIATTEALVVLATTLATHRVEFASDAATDGAVGPWADPDRYERPSVGVDSAINLEPDRDIPIRFVPRSSATHG